MYFDLNAKFFEIAIVKNIVYIHFGDWPNHSDRGKSFGTLKSYSFKSIGKLREFYRRIVHEKLNEGYIVSRRDSKPSHDLKQMIEAKTK